MTPRTDVVTLTGRYCALPQLKQLAQAPRIRIAPAVLRQIERGAACVQRLAQRDEPLYGINVGFGALCKERVSTDALSDLQRNHLLSHACGVGDAVSPEISRAVVAVKLLTFRTGHTGISRPVVERIVDFWNAGLIPVIPQKGSVGASGDLAPLAHAALPLIGEGEVWEEGQIVPAADALRRRRWKPIRLEPKDGLALTNGVQYINGSALVHLIRAADLVRRADLVAALSMQGFSTARSFYDAAPHDASFHPERQVVAANLRRLLRGSNHYALASCDAAREDPYSFRCVPQVHAAVRQTLAFGIEIIERECNGVSDNPLIFADRDELLTCGNLHGQSSAFAMDFLAIAMSELASISERRTYQLLSGQHGLPPFLTAQGGLHSGLMIPQYTAAALVNENKVLAAPASTDTIMTCHLQEDHVSMGATSVHKLATILDNAETILGIELLTAMQAVDMNPNLHLSPPTAQVHDEFRRHVLLLTDDRLLARDIEKSRAFLMTSGVVRNASGRLQ